jgi:hypothetical protein
MFSPPRREKARGDDSVLPKGDCRFIMLHPEVQGQRCACVGFALNKQIPGSTCDCGHQACYHIREKEGESVERQEFDALKEKIQELEDKERYRDQLMERLGCLEELVDQRNADKDTEMKSVYRQMSGLWHNVGQLQKRVPHYEDHVERLDDAVERMRNQFIEVEDASMKLEDRVESLENASTPRASLQSRRRRASTPPSLAPDSMLDYEMKSETSGSPRSRPPLHVMTGEEPLRIQTFRERVASVGCGSQAWTVHISLLPTSSQPFPFEKDTAAYKRCLSRGLHRVAIIPDSDDHSFRTAVSEAFSEILRGRPWRPLVAKICDAKNLLGLPMLRQLDHWLVDSKYDVGFLQQNCAVTDESGKIIDLYIAMSYDTISWAELKEVTPLYPGLEASWIYDTLLDGPCMDDDNSAGLKQENGVPDKRPAAGDILPTWSPTSTRLKRKESEISRTPSFGSSTGDEARSKLRRQCTGASVEVVGRRAEAV